MGKQDFVKQLVPYLNENLIEDYVTNHKEFNDRSSNVLVVLNILDKTSSVRKKTRSKKTPYDLHT